MNPKIPFHHWHHLSVKEVVVLFSAVPFTWCIAGGYAIELFLGQSIRVHEDIDVLVYRDEQQQVQRWLSHWHLYAADQPGSLRVWHEDEYLPYGIHDIWGHLPNSDAWQMQLMLAEVAGDEWFSRRNHTIRGLRDSLIEPYQGIPCVRIDVQLFYKAKHRKAKDELDFQACLPLLEDDARQ